jgi:HEAT repeat protein
LGTAGNGIPPMAKDPLVRSAAAEALKKIRGEEAGK